MVQFHPGVMGTVNYAVLADCSTSWAEYNLLFFLLGGNALRSAAESRRFRGLTLPLGRTDELAQALALASGSDT
jgi:hypothetical protein